MKTIALIIFFYFPLKAETHLFKIQGMHCGGCANAIQKSVCSKQDYELCEAKITDEEKQLGELIVTTKAQIKIDKAKIEKIISDGGYTVLKK